MSENRGEAIFAAFFERRRFDGVVQFLHAISNLTRSYFSKLDFVKTARDLEN